MTEPIKPLPEIERRHFAVGEVRAADKDGKPVIEMTPAIFSQYSEDLGGFTEIIEPGFFDGALEDDVRALWNHNADKVLGRTVSKTLELSQDENGLKARCYPPVTPPDMASFAVDAMVAIRRGDVSQGSFSFTVKSTWRGDEVDGDEWYAIGDQIVRRLRKGGCRQLFDVSPVTYPAYTQTSVSADTRARFDEFIQRTQGDRGRGGLPGGAQPVTDQNAAQTGLESERRKRQLTLMRMSIENSNKE